MGILVIKNAEYNVLQRKVRRTKRKEALQNMSKSIRTKCGVEAKQDKLLFDLTTTNVKIFLQGKIANINNGLTNNKVQTDLVNPNDIRVCALRIGKNFAPLFVMLPDAVIDKKQYNPNIPSIFLDSMEERSVILKPWYYKLFVRWMYSKKDSELVRSRMVQRQLGITRPEDVKTFMYYATPKIKTVTNDNGEKVSNLYVILNADTIFHDMLVDIDRPNSRFTSTIRNITMMENNAAKYEIEREINTRKKNYDTKDIEAIADKMANGN